MSKDMVYEAVPALDKREGDTSFANANNSTILLGRDRIDSASTGYGSASVPSGGRSAGAMHLIVGRRSTSPDLDADSATVYLSQKNDPDLTAGTLSAGRPMTESSAIICRADCMRLVPRNDFKLVCGDAQLLITSDGKIVIDGDVRLGKNAMQRLMLAENFAAFWSTVVIASPSGPCSPLPPIPSSCFTNKSRSE